jgi:thioredoxin 1
MYKNKINLNNRNNKVMTQTNKTNSNFFSANRGLMIALVVILIAVGGVMLLNGSRKTTTMSPETAASASSAEHMSGDVVNLSDADFEQTISQGVVLVDFWAVWCPPCRVQNPIIEEVATEIGAQATVAKLDVDHNPQSARRNAVQNIPTLIIFKDGKQVERFVGVQQKETLVAAIKNHI